MSIITKIAKHNRAVATVPQKIEILCTDLIKKSINLKNKPQIISGVCFDYLNII